MAKTFYGPRTIHIKTPSEASTGSSATITDDAGNNLANCIRRMVLTIDPGEIVRAQVDMYCSFDGPAEATFFLVDPETGDRKAVSSISFQDGTQWHADSAHPTHQPPEAA